MAAPVGVGEGGDIQMGDMTLPDRTSRDRTMEPSIDRLGSGFISPLEPRADPDAQTTVTDFLDFTEYLPSDMIRSLTLIGKLDQTYTDASLKVNELTRTWGQLPTLPNEERLDPVQLRANISEHLDRAVSSRTFAHAEAVRMSENVNRHYNKAKVLLAKLQTMIDNYPTEEQKSPVTSKSPQMVRAKLTVRAGGEGGQKVRRQHVPRITVPGEVLAPYDYEYDFSSDESDESSNDDSETGRRTPGPAPRIKLVSSKTPKSASRAARPVPFTSAAQTAAAAANAAALLQPPPEDAVIGSPDAPWLQLTQYELAKLRKRMKKNATWTPSETMIARELKLLGRGPEAFREAKKKAEEDGKIFEPPIPKPIVDDASGTEQLPAGAISVDSLAADEVPTSNRGMKLNEAKKLKREALAKQAAEDAEESARKMVEETAKLFSVAEYFLTKGNQKNATSTDNPKDKTTKSRTPSRATAKRKREEPETNIEIAQEVDEPSASSNQPPKRTKTETPVPPPTHPPFRSKLPTPEIPAPSPSPMLTPAPSTAPSTAPIPHAETPVPIPIPPQGSRIAATKGAVSPTPAAPVTDSQPPSVPSVPPVPSVPTKPHTETPVPIPIPDQRKSVTPVLPPAREVPTRETPKRETRGEAAKRSQQQQQQLPTLIQPEQTQQVVLEPTIKQSSSRGPTPRSTPGPEAQALRRPSSRSSKAMSQEPMPSLAVDRPRRASTARNTPAPEAKQLNKRTRRPAPGIVSTTNSGGNSAVGRRKAAPKTKRKDKNQPSEMVDADDEDDAVDPDEARYCLCNRVSFGTMIQCDNRDNCKEEWFHLECVELAEIPARTTKWYCPDCRVLLNIGGKGEVSARGVRK